MSDNRDVFVVHGHDRLAQLEVARFLERLQFNPIILSEQGNLGQTIIEKIETHAKRAVFAVVLLTPDDVGGVKGTPPGQLSPRARQNVIFGLGFFIAKLSRRNVVALKKGDDLEILSDFSGVIYLNMNDRGWQLDLAKEMRQAGLSVDFNLLAASPRAPVPQKREASADTDKASGSGGIHLGAGAVYVGGNATNLTGVGQGNSVVTVPDNTDLQKLAEGLELLVAELQKQSATTTETLKLALQLAEARDKAQAGGR